MLNAAVDAIHSYLKKQDSTLIAGLKRLEDIENEVSKQSAGRNDL